MPFSAPSFPSAHARSPNASVPSERTGPPVTSRGTGSAVWALRTHEVAWSAVTATIVRRGSIPGRSSPKNARSISAMTSRLSSARPSWAGTSGPLMWMYSASKPSSASSASRGPGRVVLLGQQARGVHGLHAQDQRDPAFDGHLDEAPPRRPEPLGDRLQRRPAIAAVPRQDQVPRQLARPTPRRVDLGGVEDPRGALDERVGELGGASRLGRVLERFAPGHLGLERLERHAEVPVLAVRGVGVRHLGRERPLVRADHQDAPMLHRGAQLERGVRERELLVHLVRERSRLVGA